MNPTVFIGRALRQNVGDKYLQSYRIAALYSTKQSEAPEVPKNLIKDLHSASHQSENGIIYDKKPFKIRLEAGKRYAWCLCGRSKSQPLCDGTHKNVFLKIKLRSVHFVVAETKDYWLCNCKQTSNRPFCDGTHKRPNIQEGVKN